MFTRVMVLAAGTLLAGAATASAQDHRAAFTGFVGSAAYSGLAAGADDELVLAPGAFAGAHAELFLGRLGLRLGGGYASPALENDATTGITLMTADADLVWRLRRPYPNTFFQPYAVLGGGVVRYTLDADEVTIGAEQWEEDPATRGTVVVGIGTDLGRGPVAVRLELSDIIGLSSPVTNTDGERYGAVQHVVLTFGLSLRGGSLGLPPRPEPRPVAISPSPRPRPVRPRPTPRPPVQRPAPPQTEPSVDDDVPDARVRHRPSPIRADRVRIRTWSHRPGRNRASNIRTPTWSHRR
ncbi:MAG: PRC-barrel domain-containing protein [Longimicrobiales bacterium]